MTGSLTSVELCAGAGGQALGLEQAGFEHQAVVEIDRHCCDTLKLNRPDWNIIHGDIADIDGAAFKGVDLVAAGLPCPPFSKAGKQLGHADERNLFPHAIRIIEDAQPRAFLIENVPGLLDSVFEGYRELVFKKFRRLGFVVDHKVLNARDYGVSQLRPRVAIVGLRPEYADQFSWPEESPPPPTVGECLFDLMRANGWRGVKQWRETANGIAPTLVGGSLKHGGPDLGPTRAKKAWAKLGVDGHGVANDAPEPGFNGMPRLTIRMIARLQGFPDSWRLSGKKTNAYRQVGNAFPPPVAEKLGSAIIRSLNKKSSLRLSA